MSQSLKRASVVLLALAANRVVTGEGIDLVTLPAREGVQLTVYNSADLTLVRDTRSLTFRKGRNRLSFDWQNTLIDPTSLRLRARRNPDAVALLDVSYPPGLNTKAIWTVESDLDGEVPVEISYFTSGISWRAFYMATLSRDEKTMRLDGYVRVSNGSGEDYDNAVTRVIVGKIQLLDEIAALARRQAPYGTPPTGMPRPPAPAAARPEARMRKMAQVLEEAVAEAEVKSIKKEGLSEYFLYTIEGTETIPNGWSKRLPSFSVDSIPVVNLYRFEEERYGSTAMRFLLFSNDEAHQLGETPIPDGAVTVYRTVDDDGHLSYEGATTTRYIPVEQKAELGLGPARDVLVTPVLMEIRTENHVFDNRGNINGFDEVQTFRVRVKNRREVPVTIVVTRNLRHPRHELTSEGDHGIFERSDLDTVTYTLEVPRREEKTFRYSVRYFEGERANRR